MRTGTKVYFAWGDMKNRCYNRDRDSWEFYGARGITVCDAWFDFEVFKEWAENNGIADGLSLDRIDVNGNYEPTNCRWVSKEAQNRNRRITKLTEDKVLAIRADTRPQHAIAHEYGISQGHVSSIKNHRFWRNLNE